MFSHRWGARAGAGAALLALSLLPVRATAQQAKDTKDKADEAAAVARADSARAALVQPPGSKPHPVATLVRAPFQAVTGLVGAVGALGWGAYTALDRIGAIRAGVQADQELRERDIEVRPDFIGNRSSAALVARWNGGGTPLFAEAGYSLRGYELLRGGLDFGDTLSGARLATGYDKLTQVHFWGVGPKTLEGDRSDFGYSVFDVSADAHARVAPHLRLGVSGGWEQDTGLRGTDSSVPDLEDEFPAATPFGALGTEHFARAGGTVDVDFTSIPDGGQQLSGTRLIAGWSGYHGVASTHSDFEIGTGDLRFYLPVTRQNGIALRGLASEVFGQSGAGVPIYYLPELGGGQGLRGQKGFRYRDLAMLAAQGEWRYQVWWSPMDPRDHLDAFAFVDRGAVGPSLREIAQDSFITTPGIGLRFMRGGVAKVETFLAFGGDKPRAGLKLGTTF